MFRNKITAFLLILFSMLSPATTVFAMTPEHEKVMMQISEQERKFLLMYFDEEDLFVMSTTRSLKSISRVAENVEVVTKEDIELMNAHTVAEVLNGVTGVQIAPDGGPGTIATALIQGSEFRHVAVFMDGILLNNLSDNFADIGAMPVQMIEKIEVIKGPASSAWGSSLGGVINIITKAADKTLPGGLISASLGERASGDFRAEMFGKSRGLGYYLYAGRLQSDGLTPGFDVNDNHLYTKLNFKIADRTDVFFTLFYKKDNTGDGAYDADDVAYRNKSQLLLTTLSLKSELGSEAELYVSIRSAMEDFKSFVNQLSDGAGLFNSRYRDNKYGASAQLTWRHGIHSIVIGTEYDYGILNASSVSGDEPELKKAAFFANDTIELGKFSVAPGIRYDNTNISDDFTSPSIGVTYQLADNTILRAYIARGFNNPALSWTSGSSELFEYRANPDLETEKIWSYQFGLETGVLKHVWLKANLFRHDISDVITEGPADLPYSWTYVNGGDQRRQGVEIEFKTLPVYSITLSGGAAFIDTDDLDSEEEIFGVPKYTYDIGVGYNDKKSFRALLKGHYIWWNIPADWNAEYDSFVFDLSLTKHINIGSSMKAEAFLNGHNIFDAAQYSDGINYKNPRRWIEAGLRCRF